MPTIQQIEGALRDRFGGFTVAHLEQGEPTAVPVFLGAPDPAVQPNRSYPCIGIELVGQEPDMRNVTDSGVENGTLIRVAVDESGPTPRWTREPLPVWFRFRFRLSIWTTDANADRTLGMWVESKVRPHDVLTVESVDYWLFRVAHHRDDQGDDRRVYRQLWMFDVLADLARSSEQSESYQVQEVHITSSALRTKRLMELGSIREVPVNDANEPVAAEDAERVKFRTFAFNATEFWIP